MQRHLQVAVISGAAGAGTFGAHRFRPGPPARAEGRTCERTDSAVNWPVGLELDKFYLYCP